MRVGVGVVANVILVAVVDAFLGKALFWFFVRKTLFSYGFRVISLGFQKENIHYLGYSSRKPDFPDIFAFFRFSQGKHTLS